MKREKKFLMNMKIDNIDTKDTNKTNNRTFVSAIVIAIGVFLSKIFGLLRDIVFASFLGTGPVAEAFYVAYRLPNTFRRIFAEGAMSNAFVPFFATKVKTSKQQANIFSGQIGDLNAYILPIANFGASLLYGLALVAALLAVCAFCAILGAIAG